jgi:hypothetical protein
MAVLVEDEIRTTVGIAPLREGEQRSNCISYGDPSYGCDVQAATASHGRFRTINTNNQLRKDRSIRSQGRQQDRHMDHGRTKANG